MALPMAMPASAPAEREVLCIELAEVGAELDVAVAAAAVFEGVEVKDER